MSLLFTLSILFPPIRPSTDPVHVCLANRKGLKTDPWWRQTSTAKASLVPAAHFTIQIIIHGACPSPVWCTSLVPICRSCTNIDDRDSVVCYFQINEQTGVHLALLLYLGCSCHHHSSNTVWYVSKQASPNGPYQCVTYAI